MLRRLGKRDGVAAVGLHMLVEIWSDVVCPWCYIGKRRFEAALARFAHAEEVEVRWRSFELDPTAPRQRTGDMAEHLAAKYAMTVPQATAQLERMNALAAAVGLRYDLKRTQGGNTFAAHRLIHLAYESGTATGAALKEALLHAYFVDLAPIGDTETLVGIATGIGLASETVRSVLQSDRFAEEVRADEAEAAALGCSGVPFFVFDRSLAVAGAQDADTFLAALEQAWVRRHPTLERVGDAGGLCTDDGCAI